jgi:hypothetical protein
MSEDTFPAYMQRTAALGLSNEELLARYVAGPAELEAALAGLAEDDLDLCRAEGKWTIRQYVHHVVNGDDVMCTAIEAALGKPGCSYSFDWYDHQGWVERVTANSPLEPAMALLRANRAYVADLMQRVPDAWEQQAKVFYPWFDRWETQTVRQMVFHWVCHLPWHIPHIEETRQVCGR